MVAREFLDDEAVEAGVRHGSRLAKSTTGLRRGECGDSSPKITEAEVLNAVQPHQGTAARNVTCDTVAKETGVTYHTVELHIMTLPGRRAFEVCPRKASRRDPIAVKRIEMIKAAAASFGDLARTYSDLARETDLRTEHD